MPVIGIGRHAARRQPVISRRNGQPSPRHCWPPSAPDRASRASGATGASRSKRANCSHGWFTEGFDTRDLKEAKALLEESAV
jgi:hypothetical protein